MSKYLHPCPRCGRVIKQTGKVNACRDCTSSMSKEERVLWRNGFSEVVWSHGKEQAA